MKKLASIAIVFIFIGCCIGETNLNGGLTKVVIGNEGSSSPYVVNNHPSPIFGYRSPIYSYRDPSQYDSPPLIIKPSPKPNPENNTNPSNFSISTTNNYVFLMTEKVTGSGSHTRWSLIGSINGVEEKEGSSATNGTMELSKFFIFGTSFDGINTSTQAGSSRSLTFSGSSYREIQRYSNGEEFIQKRIEAGAVKEYTTLRADFENIIYPDEYFNHPERESLRRSTNYQEDCRIAGFYSFDAYIPGNNGSMISQAYIGRMDINSKLTSLENNSLTRNLLYDPLCCMVANP